MLPPGAADLERVTGRSSWVEMARLAEEAAAFPFPFPLLEAGVLKGLGAGKNSGGAEAPRATAAIDAEFPEVCIAATMSLRGTVKVSSAVRGGVRGASLTSPLKTSRAGVEALATLMGGDEKRTVPGLADVLPTLEVEAEEATAGACFLIAGRLGEGSI